MANVSCYFPQTALNYLYFYALRSVCRSKKRHFEKNRFKKREFFMKTWMKRFLSVWINFRAVQYSILFDGFLLDSSSGFYKGDPRFFCCSYCLGYWLWCIMNDDGYFLLTARLFYTILYAKFLSNMCVH